MFLLKIQDPNEFIELENLFEVSLFRFHFASARRYLDFYYNEYPVKETTSLYLKLLLKLPLFQCVFVIFGKIDKSSLILNLVIFEYLDQIFPWNEMK